MTYRILYFFAAILWLTSCKTEKETTFFDYKGDKGELEFYNTSKKDKPLIVIIPAVYNSELTGDVLSNLISKNRVVVVNFLSHRDLTRVQQLDKLENRLTYYSDVLNSLNVDSNSILIAEGLNSILALQLGLNYNQPKLWLVNAWYPSIKEVLSTSCYVGKEAQCDSLLSYLNISSRQDADELLASFFENIPDKQYGYFIRSTWAEVIDLNSRPLLEKYNKPISWIYTNNAGLIDETEFLKLKESTGKRKDVEYLSVKDFSKYKFDFSK